VDGGREPEVEYLRDDVGGLEEDGQVRKARPEDRPELLGIDGDRSVLGLEGDEDLTVGGGDEGGVAEGEVDAPGGKTEVVDHPIDLPGRDRLANPVLDIGEPPLGLLEPGARRAANVQSELAGIDR